MTMQQSTETLPFNDVVAALMRMAGNREAVAELAEDAGGMSVEDVSDGLRALADDREHVQEVMLAAVYEMIVEYLSNHPDSD